MELTEKQPEEPINPIERENHCLQLAICLMEDLDIKNLTPQLRSLCDTLILPNIGSIVEEIRFLAVKALCLTCMLKLELAQKYTPLLLEMIQRDKKEVVLMAFRGMINLIMAFSINRLICNEEQIEDVQMITDAQKNVLTVMWSLTDNEDSDVYTTATEGFCKLYMTGHLLSAKMFSKLFIMYYSPLNENDTKLKAILSAFLPQFSFLRFNNQLCVEESFMITIKALINAPVDNYLCEIDLNKVIETLLHLTNPKNLISRKTVNKRQGHSVFENLFYLKKKLKFISFNCFKP
jgi:condensin complex subunit 3